MKLLSRYCSLLSWQYIDLITVEVPFCWLYNTKSNPAGMLISTHSAAKKHTYDLSSGAPYNLLCNDVIQ